MTVCLNWMVIGSSRAQWVIPSVRTLRRRCVGSSNLTGLSVKRCRDYRVVLAGVYSLVILVGRLGGLRECGIISTWYCSSWVETLGRGFEYTSQDSLVIDLCCELISFLNSCRFHCLNKVNDTIRESTNVLLDSFLRSVHLTWTDDAQLLETSGETSIITSNLLDVPEFVF
ncbi:hypothetical protein HanIR_Chr06g0281351 [Helianthus annuus]|nr:hypothetical protein HanIR_Chr06g0281351 [Helianthus annuus]